MRDPFGIGSVCIVRWTPPLTLALIWRFDRPSQKLMNSTSLGAIQLMLVAGSVIAALFILYPAFLAWRWGEESRSWPTVTGTITYSGTVFILSGGDGSAVHASYRPWVVCEYCVDQAKHKCRRISFGFRFNTVRSKAEKVAAEFVVGQDVLVHYMPGKPAMATLKPGISAGLLRFNLLYSAFLVTLLGCGWIWVAVHSLGR
ncbi:DUF3592 domain-containing protein [Synechococcus sp. FACHB-909]|uniref:DUF3592 domain-containing protein n=1 Tax=Synechococcus sp. FACHB-909 TaxID=2692863 RepID=UPI0016865F6F|nr:DUF3592 domain-containing protein [Synechococcus sp. FACHB-909]MBD2719199.1 DUF3592 domain-containing protein [Synechococcus sp. FACHB-909]